MNSLNFISFITTANPSLAAHLARATADILLRGAVHPFPSTALGPHMEIDNQSPLWESLSHQSTCMACFWNAVEDGEPRTTQT